MQFYHNYIFDLYGTLVDIHTNEQKPSLWRRMAEIFAVYGAEYSWREMKEAFFRIVVEEQEKLTKESVFQWPELRMDVVFRRLYLEKASSITAIENSEIELPDSFDQDKGKTWIHMIENVFRVLSRERFCLYSGTLPALKTLKKRGDRLFLLSNAEAAFTRPEIEILGLTSCFEGIYLSSDYGMKKPEPAFLNRLMEEYNLDPLETVMIGNEVSSDMKIADACGIDGLLLNTAQERAVDIDERIRNQIRRPDRIRVIRSGDLLEICKTRCLSL